MIKINNIKRVIVSYFHPQTNKYLGGFDYPFDRNKITELKEEVIELKNFYRKLRTGFSKPVVKIDFIRV